MSLWLSDDEAARFWTRVSPEDASGCRTWSGWTCGNRDLGWYGRWTVPKAALRRAGIDVSRNPRVKVYAHRTAWCLARGYPIDYLSEHNIIMHVCDNPLCCNPEHLEMGSQAENVRDMIRKNRHRHGGLRAEDIPT